MTAVETPEEWLNEAWEYGEGGPALSRKAAKQMVVEIKYLRGVRDGLLARIDDLLGRLDR